MSVLADLSTVHFNRNDPVSIIQALREVCSHETLRVVALAELQLDEESR